MAGVDEAGRGPLAGPLVVAAVLLPADFDVSGITDSKLLSPSARAHFASIIVSNCQHSIVVVEPSEIDRVNILAATLTAMSLALRGLPAVPKSALVDGNQLPPDPPCPVYCLVKGDRLNATIAAASILAKHRRDQIMQDMDKKFPGYGFATHYGYHCPQHVQALKTLGPCSIHRRSFEPVKSMVNQPCLEFAD
ncbi:ribonuclease HII [Kamptonema cortianum]|nr:ribonuclease HII [Geitlerinema splendidum]MDK3155212.1 ribonuclease HII [Kamptonema cortianum]